MSSYCSVDVCLKPTHAKGLCSTHYARQWRHGDPLVLKLKSTPKEQRANQTRRYVEIYDTGQWMLVLS